MNNQNMWAYPTYNLVTFKYANLVQEAKNWLYQATSVFVKQEVNVLEMMTGCEQKNRYDIYVRTPNTGPMGMRIFRCKEESDFCMRQCCHGDARAFKLRINYIVGAQQFGDDFQTIAWMDRPFKCTCCCLDRPEMTVYWGELDNMTNCIGKIKEPCSCCDPQMDICDYTSNVRYQVIADGCQCGICCRGTPCGKCSEVMFPIFKSDCQNKEFANRTGTIQRKFAGCMKAAFTDADNFEVTFPFDASPEDKLLMIGTSLMIDFRFYNEDSGESNNSNVVVNL